VNAEGASVDTSTNFIPRTVPNPPSIASIDENNQSAIVYFNIPVYNGGTPVTQYSYTLDSADNPSSVYIVLPTLDLSFEILSYGGQPLLNGSSYIVRLRASNAEGHSTDVSQSFVPRTVPTSPRISSITPGNGTASVTYHASSYDGGNAIIDYRYRLSSIHGMTSYISIGMTYTFNIIGLSNGVEYSMTMVAVNAEGQSAASDANTFIPFTAATSPTITKITEGNQRVDIEFVAPSFDGGSPITEYKYSLSTDGSTGYSDLAYTLSGSVYKSILQNIGLQNAVQYPLIIVAVNLGGYSTPSVVSYFTPYTTPDPPTITNVEPGSGSVTIYYTPGSNNGDTITSYLYSIDTYNYYAIDNTNPMINPFVLTGLTNGTLYAITMKAVNRAGASVASTSYAFRPRTVPDAPTIDYLIAGNQSIIVHFIAPSFNGGDAITNYSYNVGGGDISMNTTASPYTITGLTNGTSYAVTVKAINVAGSSASSNTITAIPFTNPDSPTNVILTASLESIVVNFTAPAYNGGYSIINYIYSLNGGSDVYTNTTSTTFTIGGLTKGTSYQLKMKSVSFVTQSVNYSPLSNTVVAYGTSDPPVINSVMYGDKSGTVYYTPPSFQGGDTDIQILYYTYSLNGAGYVNIGLTNPYTITGLVNGTSYTVIMRAVNIAGESANSNTILFVPKTNPSPPLIQSVDPSNGSLKIQYSFTSDGGSALLKYMYSLNSIYYPDFVDVPITYPITPIIVTGLSNGTPYLVRMVAMNDVGYSNFAVASTSAIPYHVPDAPTILNTKSFDGMQRFTIDTPFNQGRPLLGYKYTTVPEVDVGESGYIIEGTLDPNVTQFYVNDLSNGYYYQFNIQSYNVAGYSSTTSTRILAGSSPFPPVFTSVVGGNNSITFSWKVLFDGGSPIIGARYSVNGGPYIETGVASTPYTYTITNLLRGDYGISLIVYNIENESRPGFTSGTAVDPPKNSAFFSSNTSRDGTSYVDKIRTEAAGIYTYYGGVGTPISILSKPKSIYKTHVDNLSRMNSKGKVIGKITYRPDKDITNIGNT
jgi:titin